MATNQTDVSYSDRQTKIFLCAFLASISFLEIFDIIIFTFNFVLLDKHFFKFYFAKSYLLPFFVLVIFKVIPNPPILCYWSIPNWQGSSASDYLKGCFKDGPFIVNYCRIKYYDNVSSSFRLLATV